MSILYTKTELLKKVDEWLTPEKISLLYKQNFVNYLGITSDTKEKYTEVIAEHLLSNLSAFDRIERISRESKHPVTSGNPLTTHRPGKRSRSLEICLNIHILT